MSERFSLVVRLAIYEENERAFFSRNGAQACQKVVSYSSLTSTLTEHFQLYSIDAAGLNGVKAWDVLYVNIVKYSRFYEGRFRPRERDIPSVGRIYFTRIIKGDQYYLKILLSHVKGPHIYISLWKACFRCSRAWPAMNHAPLMYNLYPFAMNNDKCPCKCFCAYTVLWCISTLNSGFGNALCYKNSVRSQLHLVSNAFLLILCW